MLVQLLEPRHLLAGDLDPTFGQDGIVTTELLHNQGSYEEVWGTAVDSSGRIIAVGTGGRVIRYSSAGEIDASFANTGLATFPGAAMGVAIQNDGRIVVAGQSSNGMVTQFLLARYMPDGSLDPTFDGDGTVTTALAGKRLNVGAVGIQADGSIVVAGTARNIVTSDDDFVLARYLPDGSLDGSFGAAGMVITDFGGADSGESLAIQGDGKIIVAGWTEVVTHEGRSKDFAIARYNANGALDSSFFSSGKRTLDFGSTDEGIRGVAVQPDGKIVVAGWTRVGGQTDFALARLTPAGALDPTFGDSGTRRTDFFGRNDEANAVVIASNGSIVVAGSAFPAGSFGPSQMAVARYLPAGVLDPDFGSGGMVLTDIASGDDGANALALQSDGKIIAAGYANNSSFMNPTGYDFALVRYNTDGSLDTSFSGDGKVTTAIGHSQDEGRAVAIQSDGRVLVAGRSRGSTWDYSLIRYHADGTLDASFGNGGIVTTDVAQGDDEAHGIVIQGDGKIVVAGRSRNGNRWDFSLARYHPDGALDTSFGTGGKVTTHFGANDLGYAVALQDDGKIIVVGQSKEFANADFALARYNADGTLDTSFGIDGRVTTDFGGSEDVAYGVVLQSDGKILVAGQAVVGSNFRIGLARYNSDGSLDQSIGNGGRVAADLAGLNMLATAVTLQPDGRILVAGAAVKPGIPPNQIEFDFAVARYETDGTPDASFGQGGLVLTDFASGNDVARGIAVHADGRIVVAGYGSNGTNDDFAVARYLPDGTLDASFGNNGKTLTPIGPADDTAYGVAIQANGDIIVAGYAMTGSSFDVALVRYQGGIVAEPSALALAVSANSMSENGGTIQLTATRSGADVSQPLEVALESSHPTRAAVPNTALIPAGELSTTVEIVAIDNAIVDGSQLVTITVSAAGFVGDAVTIEVLDDDVSGFAVVQSGGTTVVSEDGTSDTFTVVLTAQPLTNVIFTVTSANTGEVTVAPATLTFTPANWNVPQTVTVTGVDDQVVDGNQITDVTIAVAAGSDGAFAGLASQIVQVTTLDNDAAGFAIVQSGGGTVVSEDGTSDTFTVVLNVQPLSDVIFTVTSANTGEVTVAPATLTFTPANWNVPQTVTVTGVDDQVVDGDQITVVTVAVAPGSDPAFAGLASQVVQVTTLDNDVAGFTIVQSGGSTVVSEDGTSDTFTVVLNVQPLSDVIFTVTSANTGEVTVSPETLTFTPANWNVPQTVTVTGVDDQVVDGDQITAVTVAVATGSDGAFAGLVSQVVQVTTLDNDAAGFTIVQSDGSTVVSEDGTSDTFTVVLNAQPLTNVSFTVTSANSGEVTVAPATLTFTPANWNVPQTVTVTGVDDQVVDGNQITAVTVAVAAGSDPAFADLASQSVQVTTLDNDVAGFVIIESGDSTVVSENGTTDTFTVALTAQPLTNVIFTVTSANIGEVTVAPATLTFTPENWSVPQTVTVTGVDDQVVDGNQITNVTVAVAEGSDGAFAGLVSQVVQVTTLDNDAAGFTIVQSDGSTVVSEDGTSDTFTVVLNAQPLTNVSFTVTSANSGEVTVAPATLTFTPENWSVPQTVTVTGVDDQVVDGNQITAVTVAVAAGSDPAFADLASQSVQVTTLDNDVAGFVIIESGGSTVVSESGTTDTFTVVLTAQPLTNVIFTVTSANTGEVTVAPATLTFTPANWNVAQTVTVTGVDDQVVDGDQVTAVTVAVAAGSDGAFAGVASQVVYVTTLDNDVPGGLMPVAIQIHPGNPINPINPRSGGTTTVAIYSTATFDAVRSIDFNTLTFGRTGQEESLAYKKKGGAPEVEVRDVNRDGIPDIVVHFVTRDLGFLGGETQGILRGLTVDGRRIEGRDTVRVVGNAQAARGEGEFTGTEGPAIADDFTTTIHNFSWRNIAAPLDVNDDGQVNALDALLILNALSQGHGGNLSPATTDPRSDIGFVDVNGDGQLTPLDALVVLNHLGRQTRMAAVLANHHQDEREREPADPDDRGFPLDLLAVDVVHAKAKGRA